MIFDAAHDLQGHHCHLMNLSVGVPSLVKLVMHLTIKEAKLLKTCVEMDLQMRNPQEDDKVCSVPESNGFVCHIFCEQCLDEEKTT
jgi:hypothetical protein